MLLVFLFIALPVTELALLLKVGAVMGWFPTLVLVIATGVVGAALARSQGFQVIARLQRESAEGRVPASAMVDGALIFVAATLLITPGIVTDVVGFSLLIPPIRDVIKRGMSRRFESSVRSGRTVVFFSGRAAPRPPPRPDPDRIYEARFEDE